MVHTAHSIYRNLTLRATTSTASQQAPTTGPIALDPFPLSTESARYVATRLVSSLLRKILRKPTVICQNPLPSMIDTSDGPSSNPSLTYPPKQTHRVKYLRATGHLPSGERKYVGKLCVGVEFRACVSDAHLLGGGRLSVLCVGEVDARYSVVLCCCGDGATLSVITTCFLDNTSVRFRHPTTITTGDMEDRAHR
ncbi:hypothetical protein ASPTUDRAFT_34372 [Aspergillus tubingensis CBS 134.48]|uniref:Uncharacterized protein n=1 Tax=Aspergillus tubingensis (strain CBS 134.48) TaxID=767770 RepID=A0A1L9NJN9_ASPTC|nr:hypothetical protein ASPTUDRAFT_34372 [Aspergillus tubingensis CBS 134.48]